MSQTLTIEESRLLMRLTQRLCRPTGQGGLLADKGLADDLVGLFRADFLGHSRWNPAHRAFENVRCFGRDQEMAKQYVESFQFEDPISPKARHLREPTLVYDIMPRDELMRTRYYSDFLLPFKTVDGLDLHLYQGTHNVGDLRIWRAPGCKPLGEHEAVLLELLRPYLLNAMLSFDELASPDGGIDLAAAEHCRWPCFTSAPQLGIRTANAAADRLMADLSEADAQELLSCIEQVAQTGYPYVWDEFTLCVARSCESAIAVVQFVPVLSATGAAFGLERAFGLTPREAHVCLLLAEGHTDHRIAATLGISYWTVRTHLRKAFIKCDVENRVELTRALVTLI
jgi:DNA-binding CsgD family transcriptional regulator